MDARKIPLNRADRFRFCILVGAAALLLPLLLLAVWYTAKAVKSNITSPDEFTVLDILVRKEAREFRVLPSAQEDVPRGDGDIRLYGDSWTGGFGVAFGHSYAAMLHEHFKGQWRVAMSARNGADLARQYIDMTLETKVPRLSVIFFNLGNDIETSMMESPYNFGMHHVRLNQEGTDIDIAKADPTMGKGIRYTEDFQYLNRLSHGPGMLSRFLNDTLYMMGFKEEFLYYSYYLSQYFYSTNGGWKYVTRFADPQLDSLSLKGYALQELLLRKVRQRTQGRVLVVLLPPREAFSMDIFRRLYEVAAARQGIAHRALDFQRPRQMMGKLLQTLDIPVVDVFQAMEQALLEGKEIFIPFNDHPNWLGHRVIYHAVREPIQACLAATP